MLLLPCFADSGAVFSAGSVSPSTTEDITYRLLLSKSMFQVNNIFHCFRKHFLRIHTHIKRNIKNKEMELHTNLALSFHLTIKETMFSAIHFFQEAYFH